MNPTVVAAALAAVGVLLLAPLGAPARWPGVEAAPSPRGADPVSCLGRWVRRAAHRPVDSVADRRWGWSVLATAALVPLSLPFAVSVPVLVGARDVLRRRSERRRRQDQHESALPEVLELVAVAIRAGGTVPAAMTLLEQRGPGVTAPAFRAVLARAAAGMPLTVALADLPGLLGEPYRPLTAALVSAEADGAPLVTVVNQLSLDAQQARRRLAESRARQVPVRLLLPLVCCTLPAVLVIAVVPLAIVGGGLPG